MSKRLLHSRRKLHRVVLQNTLAFLGGSLLLSAVCHPFATSEWKGRIFAESIAWTGANLVLHLALSPLDEKVAELASHLLFAADAQKGFTMVHEMGHWAMGKLLVQKEPSIALNHFTGSTSYYARELSSFGQILGQRATVCTIAIAGPLFDLLATGALIAVGSALQPDHPVLGSAILFSSGMNVVKCIAYPLSALCSEDLSNDYVLFSRLIS